ncbi:hypothetical protein ACU4GI_32710 [Cupriavidus basilensis]
MSQPQTSKFPDRVRFNWGFHDGTRDKEDGRVRDMDAHYDRTYADGYVRGVLDFHNTGERAASSDRAWESYQDTLGRIAAAMAPRARGIIAQNLAECAAGRREPLAAL